MGRAPSPGPGRWAAVRPPPSPSAARTAEAPAAASTPGSVSGKSEPESGGGVPPRDRPARGREATASGGALREAPPLGGRSLRAGPPGRSAGPPGLVRPAGPVRPR